MAASRAWLDGEQRVQEGEERRFALSCKRTLRPARGSAHALAETDDERGCGDVDDPSRSAFLLLLGQPFSPHSLRARPPAQRERHAAHHRHRSATRPGHAARDRRDERRRTSAFVVGVERNHRTSRRPVDCAAPRPARRPYRGACPTGHARALGVGRHAPRDDLPQPGPPASPRHVPLWAQGPAPVPVLPPRLQRRHPLRASLPLFLLLPEPEALDSLTLVLSCSSSSTSFATTRTSATRS